MQSVAISLTLKEFLFGEKRGNNNFNPWWSCDHQGLYEISTPGGILHTFVSRKKTRENVAIQKKVDWIDAQ